DGHRRLRLHLLQVIEIFGVGLIWRRGFFLSVLAIPLIFDFIQGRTYQLTIPGLHYALLREDMKGGWNYLSTFLDNTALTGAQFDRECIERQRLLDVPARELHQLIDARHRGSEPFERNFLRERFELASDVLIPNRREAVRQPRHVVQQGVQNLEIRFELL